jgi:hypothetical protein
MKKKYLVYEKSHTNNKTFVVLLQYNFEAIHNKDNSVVKTFKAASSQLSLFLCKNPSNGIPFEGFLHV